MQDDRQNTYKQRYSVLANARHSLRFRLQFLLVAMALPALGATLLAGFQERQNVAETHREQAARLSEVMAHAQARVFEDTEGFLRELALAPEVQDPSSPECGAFLSKILKFETRFINLGVPGADGELLCNALPLNKPVNVADRPYIRKALDERVFSVGTFQVDRAVKVASVNFAYPVIPADGDGSPVGAAVAVVSLDSWSEAIDRERLPDGARVYIVDHLGAIIAAHPPNPSKLGQKVGLKGYFELEPGQVSAEPCPEGDGVNCLYSRSELYKDDQGNLVTVCFGLPAGDAIRAANERALRRISVLGIGMIAIWLFVSRGLEYLVFRPLRAMVSEIGALEDGSEGGQTSSKPDTFPYVSDFKRIAQSFRNVATERSRAVTEEKARTDQMAALLDAMPDIFFRIDSEARILDYRANQTENLIAAPAEFMGRKVSDILPPSAYDAFYSAFQQQQNLHELVTWEYQLVIGGQLKDFEARLNAIAHTQEYVVVVRDITRRRRTERLLQRTIKNLPGAILSVRQNTVDFSKREILYASPQCIDIWGYTAKELRADPSILDRYHDPDDLPEFSQKIEHMLHTLEPFAHRYRSKVRSGGERWLELHMSASATESDDTVLVDALVLDVTEQVETERELDVQREMADRAQRRESISQMTGGVAHDFNNLLAVVMGNLELLHDDTVDDENLRQIDASIHAIERGADLTRKMLAFARQAPLAPEVFNLKQMVLASQQWISRTLPATITVETAFADDLWPIKADPGSSESALLNLILNARDAMPDGGTLTISAQNMQKPATRSRGFPEDLQPGSYVVLSVKDTGIGIPAEHLKSIFQPFYSTKSPDLGSGLGLSMVQGFVSQSGGAIDVTSTLGGGTTFRLFFPRSHVDGKAIAARTKLDNGDAIAGRVLLAEDEDEVRGVISQILKKAGFSVVAAETGDKALEMFKADPTFDILLTDVVMPGALQGPGLIRAVRALSPDIKIVAMTGYAENAESLSKEARKGDVVLTKPVRREDLIAALR